jgi:hypothetical protein
VLSANSYLSGQTGCTPDFSSPTLSIIECRPLFRDGDSAAN